MYGEKLFLGIDVGHTVIKIAAYNQEGMELISVGQRVSLQNPKPGYYQTDVEELFSSCVIALKNLVKHVNPQNIEAIGLCGGGNGLYALDENFTPLKFGYPALDRRAVNVIRELKREKLYDVLFNKIGMPILPGSVPILMRWFKDNDRGIYDKVAVIMSRKDIVRYMLTGDISTEISDACFGLLNVYTQEYDREIFEILKIQDKFDALPELRPNSYDIAGYISDKAASLTGLKAGIPVIAGAHDACCNTIGVGALGSDKVCTGGGTWSINLIVVEKPILNPKWSCEAFIKKGTWILEGSSPTATVSLDWFIDTFMKEEKSKLKGKSIYQICDETIRKVKTGIIFLPFLLGLPWGYPFKENALAAFIGIRYEDSISEFLRAIYEGVTFIHATHIGEFEKYFNIKEIRFTGGAARSSIWAQMLSDVTGKRVLTIDKEETGCFGSAILAMYGINAISRLEEAERMIKIRDVFYPDEERKKEYDKKYKLYLGISSLLEEFWDDLESVRIH
jgi:L-xylulokinase